MESNHAPNMTHIQFYLIIHWPKLEKHAYPEHIWRIFFLSVSLKLFDLDSLETCTFHLSLSAVKHVPSWFPGANFKNTLEQIRKEAFEMVNSPIEMIKEAMVLFSHSTFNIYSLSFQQKGEAPPSVASSLIEQFAADNTTRSSEYEDIIKHVPGSAYFAGIDSVKKDFSTPITEKN